MLNGEHNVVSELDIFNRVGRGAAHDEIIPFTIRGGKLRVNGETSQIDGNKISIEFLKVRIIILMKYNINDRRPLQNETMEVLRYFKYCINIIFKCILHVI